MELFIASTVVFHCCLTDLDNAPSGSSSRFPVQEHGVFRVSVLNAKSRGLRRVCWLVLTFLLSEQIIAGYEDSRFPQTWWQTNARHVHIPAYVHWLRAIKSTPDIKAFSQSLKQITAVPYSWTPISQGSCKHSIVNVI